MTLAFGLLLAVASTAALGVGWVVQHAEAAAAPPLSLRRPFHSLRLLFANVRWLLGFVLGIGGWGLYIAALALAPLSLVQGVSAGGIGVIALAVRARSEGAVSRAEWAGVAVAVTGLVLLAATLGAGVPHGRAPSIPAAVWWLGASALAATLLAGPVARVLAGGAGMGLAAGILYAAGDVATKAAVDGRWPFVVAVLAAHGAAFVALQLAFQRGGALATAGLNALATNALPIAAGVALFHEGFPAGIAGVLRGVAFAAAVAGGALLARPETVAEPIAA